ncbi:MAG: hypothetical protein Q9218_004463 [Villophora microphyllina]
MFPNETTYRESLPKRWVYSCLTPTGPPLPPAPAEPSSKASSKEAEKKAMQEKKKAKRKAKNKRKMEEKQRNRRQEETEQGRNYYHVVRNEYISNILCSPANPLTESSAPRILKRRGFSSF